MKNQKGVSMITLIITIIVIIILAAIAFVGMDDATGGAQFSGFAQEFGDYQLNFKSKPVGDLKQKYMVDGVSLTDAQYYYMAAQNKSADDATVKGMVVPAGVTFAALGGTDKITSLAADDVCYVIADDSKVAAGYKTAEKFYGDNLGTETHYVSEKGFVFTLPGFPRTVDENGTKEYRMYISPNEYYISDESHTDIATTTATTEDDGLQVNGTVTETPDETPGT